MLIIILIIINQLYTFIFSVALTNGHTINLDINKQPQLQFSGIVSKYFNGDWVPTCISAIDLKKKEPKIISNKFTLEQPSFWNDVCNRLGFR